MDAIVIASYRLLKALVEFSAWNVLANYRAN